MGIHIWEQTAYRQTHYAAQRLGLRAHESPYVTSRAMDALAIVRSFEKSHCQPYEKCRFDYRRQLVSMAPGTPISSYLASKTYLICSFRLAVAEPRD